ncbi:MAG: hypothetical protein FJ265_02560 [Planctomycetes bacterium]|nr:hypothetical protein [Planctomycetota bacterium]
MGMLLALPTVLLLQDPPPAPPPAPPPPHAEVVLAEAADPVPLRAFGLGEGGLDPGAEPGRLRWAEHGCTTGGGVSVECRAVGVKLTFPSGRELLFAADGALHLRSGEAGGPFPFGAELRLGDGSAVRVLLAPGRQDRLREVCVVDGGRAALPWRRGQPARESVDPAAWAGVRLSCCGDGGDLFRTIGLGPLVVLDRVLVAADREREVPRERLVVLTAPLLQSLAALPRQHRAPDPLLRQAVRAVAATADRGGAVFPAGASLQRTEREELRWALRGGYELQLAPDGPNAPRLALFAGRSARPMVEWTLGGSPAAFLTNPDEQPGAGRWHGNGTRLPRVAADLQARADLGEPGLALQVLQRLRR